MADLTVTPANVSLVDAFKAEIHPGLPASGLNPGDIVYLNSSGKFAPASSAASGTTKTPGIALEKAGVRQGVSILRRGKVSGYDLSALAYGALVYLSDTAGKLASAAGTVSVVVGKVVPMSDADQTKVLYVEFPWLT